MGKKWKQWQILFSWAPKSLWTVTTATKLKDAYSLKENYDKPRECIKNQRHHFADKGLYSQSYGLPSSHEQMWELDHKESWAPKNRCFELWCWRRFLRVPWTARRSHQSQSILKEISPEYFLDGLMLKLKTLILWPLDAKNWLTGKKPWCWERLKAGAEGDDRG